MLVSIEVSERYHKAVNTIWLSINHQFAEASSVSSKSAKISRPPLGRGSSGTMNHELVRVLVVGGSCLQTSNIRAVAKFSLAVVTEDLVTCDKITPVFPLLLITLRSDGKSKHRVVHTNRHKPLEVVDPAVVRVLRQILVQVDIRPVLMENS